MHLNVQIPEKLGWVFDGPARYRGAYGGRGSAKSRTFTRMALLRGLEKPLKVLCAREIQSTIRESLHAELCGQVDELGLGGFYRYGTNYLYSIIGGEFIYRGLRHDSQGIKSLADIDLALVEEAEYVGEKSWRDLIPTIRKPGSEIWLVWNRENIDSATNKRFIIEPPPNAKIAEMNWRDNPWFTPELEAERLRDLRRDPDMYQHVWEGQYLTRGDAQVLKGKWRVENFTPAKGWDGPYYGADWGFATDPTVLLKMWIFNKCLYVEYEVFGYGTELDDIPQLFDKIPGARQYRIYADSARPETISHIKRKGFNIDAAEKWPQSVEDGVEFLRGAFDAIIVHTRCPHTAEECRLYSFKIDRLTGDVVPEIVDKHNHAIDSMRYGLHKMIQKRPRRFFDI